MPNLSSEADRLKNEVKSWWESDPMLYDWERTLGFPPGSREFYKEVDRRFWLAAPFAHSPGGTPFGRLIEYEKWRGKRVLEIGCGSGAHTAQLARSGAETTAVDLTNAAVELTSRRLGLFDLHAGILQADAERLPFESNSFDMVWSWGVIHHTPRTAVAISEIHRVLKPGGEARLMVYHRSSIFYWINVMLIRGVLMGGLVKRSPSDLIDHHSDGRIARYFTARQLLRLMGEFSSAHSRVLSQPAEVYPLPRWLKAHAIRIVPTALTKSLAGRWGRFLYVQASK